MSEDTRYLDGHRYDELMQYAADTRARKGPSDLVSRDVAESVLYHEARLLDEGRYEEWSTLLSEDCIYWVPAQRDIGDPRLEASVNFDDRRRLLDRIALIRSGYLHAQTPASRTVRMIGNIETWTGAHTALYVRSALSLWMTRSGEFTVFAGIQEHELVPAGESWKIRTRIIRLLDCDQPLGNISFIL